MVRSILENASDPTLAENILDSFVELERNFNLGAWKTSELDSGHFVEAVRRFLELQLFGTYTPIGRNLRSFNDAAINSYLNATGDETYRIHIPRALLLIYGIRNKRGVGHISLIKANKVDATLIISVAKWVLAELIRVNSTYNLEETEGLIDQIIERNIEGIWDTGEIKRLLFQHELKLKEQILVLLFHYDSLDDNSIFNILENGNFTYLKKVLKQLHTQRLIEYKSNGECILSPRGSKVAEILIIN